MDEICWNKLQVIFNGYKNLTHVLDSHNFTVYEMRGKFDAQVKIIKDALLEDNLKADKLIILKNISFLSNTHPEKSLKETRKATFNQLILNLHRDFMQFMPMGIDLLNIYRYYREYTTAGKSRKVNTENEFLNDLRFR